MAKGVIRLGDPTDHGGAVVSASASHYTVGGIAVAGWATNARAPRRATVVASSPKATPSTPSTASPWPTMDT